MYDSVNMIISTKTKKNVRQCKDDGLCVEELSAKYKEIKYIFKT